MATPVIKAPEKPADRRLRLEDILKLMVADGLVSSSDAEKVARQRTKQFDHPLQAIAHQQWQN